MCSGTSRLPAHYRTFSIPSPPPPAQSRYTGRYGGGGRRSVSLAPRPDPVALRQLPRPHRPSLGHDQRSNVSHPEEHKQRVPKPQDGHRTVEPGPHPAMTIAPQPPNRSEPPPGPQSNGAFFPGKRESMSSTKLFFVGGTCSLLNTSQAFLADHRSLDRRVQSPRGAIRGTGTEKECVFGRTPAHLSLTYAPTYRGLLLLVNQNGLRRLPTFLNDWNRVDHDFPRFTTMTRI